MNGMGYNRFKEKKIDMRMELNKNIIYMSIQRINITKKICYQQWKPFVANIVFSNGKSIAKK